MLPSIKGQSIIQLKKYLENTFGPEAIEKVSAKLNETDRAVFNKTRSASFWEPEQSFIAMLCAAEEIFGNTDFKLCEEIGYYSAREAVPSFFKKFISFWHLEFVIKKTNIFWNLIHNHGSLEVKMSGKQSCEGHLCGYQTPHKSFCHYLIGYFKGVLELLNVEKAIVKEMKCLCQGDPCCEFVATWE